MKIALLSNVTVEVLAGMLRGEHEVWTPSGFGAWMETALEPPQDLADFAPDLICLLLDRRYGTFDPAVHDLTAARMALQAKLPRTAVIAPDVERLAADLGEAFYDEKMWALGRMPFSLKGLRELKKLFALKKAVAVDLDNTLWKGIVSEDGADGVVPDVAFQRTLKALKARGILLVALSKNNAADVEPMWSDSRMVLRREDFVELAIDWNEKPDNLRRIAQTLNLGSDAFVFVDDRPSERMRMRACAPEVAVADFPPQLEAFFPFEAATDEDRRKTELYRAEAQRREAATGLSPDDYLKSLETWATVRPARAEDVPRLAQLSQKSNQFNVCTNRYSEAEVAAFAADADRFLVSVCAGDRFGDHGLVAFVQAVVRGDAAEIVDWVMSCRVMNKRLEFAVEDEVERLLRARGVRTLRATWRKTPKNAPAADLFDRLGFAPVGVSESLRAYELSLDGPRRRHHFVRLEEGLEKR